MMFKFRRPIGGQTRSLTEHNMFTEEEEEKKTVWKRYALIDIYILTVLHIYIFAQSTP